MSLSTVHFGRAFEVREQPTGSAASAVMLRSLLLMGCMLSVAMAAWLGQPAAFMQQDPELARLLRGMAVIKGFLVLAAVAVLLWRFGWPTPRRTAAAYVIGAWMSAGAAMLVWQLSLVPLAAVVFHVGELMLLFVAWRDHRGQASKVSVLTSGQHSPRP